MKIAEAETPQDAPKRRGRPPGSTAKNRNVTDALAVMDGLYSAGAQVCMVTGRVNAAESIASRADAMHETNKHAFEASPALARVIARMGQGSGVLSFFAAHAMLALGVVHGWRLDALSRENGTGDASSDVE